MSTATTRWMSLSRREQAKAIAAYKRLPFAVGEETQRLLDENAALRRRVRLARAQLTTLVNRNLDSTDTIVTETTVFDVLDLRKPIGRRR